MSRRFARFTPLSHFVPDSLTATVGSLALVATPLAVIVAPLLLRGYAIQIRQLMLLRQVAEPPESWLARLRHVASSTSPLVSALMRLATRQTLDT